MGGALGGATPPSIGLPRSRVPSLVAVIACDRLGWLHRVLHTVWPTASSSAPPPADIHHQGHANLGYKVTLRDEPGAALHIVLLLTDVNGNQEFCLVDSC